MVYHATYRAFGRWGGRGLFCVRRSSTRRGISPSLLSGRYRDGTRERVRYRLAFIRRGEQTPAVLYDNHDPKGHHRHVEDVEEPYKFFYVDGLLADFASDVRRVIGGTKWPRH